MDGLALLGSSVRIRSHRVVGRIVRDESMLLAIEQGNTNSLFAIHDGDHWIAQWRTATEPTRTADEYVVWLSQLMAMHKLALEC